MRGITNLCLCCTSGGFAFGLWVHGDTHGFVVNAVAALVNLALFAVANVILARR